MAAMAILLKNVEEASAVDPPLRSMPSDDDVGDGEGAGAGDTSWSFRLVMRHRSRIACLAAAVVALLSLWSTSLSAAPKGCEGPSECCPTVLAEHLAAPVVVRLGVLLVGLYEVEEKTSTWKADFYLSESWKPTPGFAPATEISNEVERQSEQFDTTQLLGNGCVRTRRIHSTLHTSYNLRAFPFDRQHLTLQFSDAWFAFDEVRYASSPSVSGLDAAAQEQLSNWKVTTSLGYTREKRTLEEAEGATAYDYATFVLPVRRHITFHLTRFFLPLLIIVALAFSVFWIDPADLSSKVSVGVTCLLSAIALQFAEGGTLPEVEYLTLADRIYATCYVALALALLATLRSAALAKRGDAAAALRSDRKGRSWFPVGLLLALVLCVVRVLVDDI